MLHTVPEEKALEALAKLPGNGLPNLFLPRQDHFLKVDALGRPSAPARSTSAASDALPRNGLAFRRRSEIDFFHEPEA
ncbi:MAG: hypothetical protein U0794_00920 [Isosphaeraceae bacterium]